MNGSNGSNGSNGQRRAEDGLPGPARGDRWQPLRLGLLNMYRFDAEEFRFEGGRLLLRGNNGTGKSRILALTLPFLLDGELAPHRLEPDQDPAKRAEWNLLLGRHDDRLGYTWIEFGRLDAGVARYVTLGCGMRAVRGKGVAQRWYFTTERRVGVDLALVADAGQALTKGRLEEALGERGHVHDTAKAYRADVDRRLFGLGEHRYEALVDLLIQLRRPQLSRQLDEAALSAALSESLSPLPQAVVDDVAEAFRTLENDRAALASFVAAAEATRAFLGAYRRYAGIAVRRRAKAVTSANSAYETTQRSLRAAATAGEEARSDLDRIEGERRDAREDARRRGEQVRTLEASPAMDRARELDHARQDAATTKRLADDADQDVARAGDALGERERRRDAARTASDQTRQQVREASRWAQEAASGAAVDDDHARWVTGLGLPDVRDGASRLAAGDRLADAVERRGRGLAHLRQLTAARDRSAGDVRDARTRLGAQVSALAGARDEEVEAAAAGERAVAAALERYRRWATEAREVRAVDADDVAWQLEAWRAVDDGRSPLTVAVDDAVAAARATLATDRAELDGRRGDAEQERAEVAAEHEQVATARHLPPPPPHTRDATSRQGRAGAPLWQLVELTDGVAAEVAGYESALEAAGLLDAWVTPDGRVLDADDHDTAILATGAPAPDGGLARLLRPAIDRDDPQAAAVGDATVADVLARIGAAPDAGEVWVSADGRFRVGPLHGVWHKQQAEHLGHAARQAARRRRLAELDRVLAAIDERLDGLAADADRIDRRAVRLAAEVEAAPTDTAIRAAEAARAQAAARVARLRGEVAVGEEAVAARRRELEKAERARTEAATDLGLADHLDRLDGLTAALADYRERLARLWPTLDGHAARLDDLDRATADHTAAAAEHARLVERAAALRGDAIAAASRRDTLEATVGAEVEEILSRLEDAKRRMEATQRRLDALQTAHEEARVAVGVAETRIEDLTEALAGDAERRGQAIERLAAAVRAGLLPVAGVDDDDARSGTADEWSADRAVRTARRIDQALDDVATDDVAWTRTQQTILGHFSDLERELLAHDLRPAGSFDDELFVVTTTFQGEVRAIPALRDLLASEIENRQALLSAREREIIENHLIGDVAAHLHELLRAGEEWVAEVNAELERMPTSTGMKLRFAWRPRSDGPAGLTEARRRMLAHHAGWSPEQRHDVGAFLQERIAEVRGADDTGTWQQHLAEALDYRLWHSFVVERHQDGEWKPLTRRTHGTSSGGEKALALTVPQFAAAAAHYRSADPHAPRLIMLDEAFVGIDSDMRSKCMGLLEQFDLDLVMTSEREWGCYPTVPAIAIAQLTTRPGIDAVGVSRWVWNGRERVAAGDGQAAIPARLA
ncbi:MAG: TIGR02680 family protein [Actinobacteria bacterium]|nr:TIGR02680 family protein [Actinomycetota bacterium]